MKRWRGPAPEVEMDQPYLFEAFPALRGRIPWVALGSFPTPVQPMERLGREVGLRQLYVKRDDLSSPHYGGNKVRKLEFLLGDAQCRGSRVILTVGAAGTNHGLATTIHARRLGMRAVLFLVDQPPADIVRRNLLLDHRHGAKLVSCSPRMRPLRIAAGCLAGARLLPPRLPYYIPGGGSCPCGCLGFVNAAFELKRQVEEAVLPEPDYVFLAAGTLGTAGGLALGCRLAGLGTKVIGVRVCDRRLCNAGRMVRLIRGAGRLLRRASADVPEVRIPAEQLHILDGYFGRQYGLLTEEAAKAIAMMKDLEGIQLEGTYTGKALAGALDHSVRSGWQDQTILFWNTYNSVDLSAQAEGVDWRELPRPFHRYFESPLQELG